MTGLKGDTGSTGSAGASGKDGSPGRDGMTGRSGKDGAAGRDGKAGASGNRLTREEVQDIIGDRIGGIKGAPGKAGIDGATGAPGKAGFSGASGSTGKMGTQGKTGARGKDGRDGQTQVDSLTRQEIETIIERRFQNATKELKGDTGRQGRPGKAGAQGGTGPQGPSGPNREDSIADVKKLAGNITMITKLVESHRTIINTIYRENGTGALHLEEQIRNNTRMLKELQEKAANASNLHTDRVGPAGPPGAPGLSGKRGPAGRAGKSGSWRPGGRVGKRGSSNFSSSVCTGLAESQCGQASGVESAQGYDKCRWHNSRDSVCEPLNRNECGQTTGDGLAKGFNVCVWRNGMCHDPVRGACFEPAKPHERGEWGRRGRAGKAGARGRRGYPGGNRTEVSDGISRKEVMEIVAKRLEEHDHDHKGDTGSTGPKGETGPVGAGSDEVGGAGRADRHGDRADAGVVEKLQTLVDTSDPLTQRFGAYTWSMAGLSTATNIEYLRQGAAGIDLVDAAGNVIAGNDGALAVDASSVSSGAAAPSVQQSELPGYHQSTVTALSVGATSGLHAKLITSTYLAKQAFGFNKIWMDGKRRCVTAIQGGNKTCPDTAHVPAGEAAVVTYVVPSTSNGGAVPAAAKTVRVHFVLEPHNAGATHVHFNGDIRIRGPPDGGDVESITFNFDDRHYAIEWRAPTLVNVNGDVSVAARTTATVDAARPGRVVVTVEFAVNAEGAAAAAAAAAAAQITTAGSSFVLMAHLRMIHYTPLAGGNGTGVGMPGPAGEPGPTGPRGTSLDSTIIKRVVDERISKHLSKSMMNLYATVRLGCYDVDAFLNDTAAQNAIAATIAKVADVETSSVFVDVSQTIHTRWLVGATGTDSATYDATKADSETRILAAASSTTSLHAHKLTGGKKNATAGVPVVEVLQLHHKTKHAQKSEFRRRKHELKKAKRKEEKEKRKGETKERKKERTKEKKEKKEKREEKKKRKKGDKNRDGGLEPTGKDEHEDEDEDEDEGEGEGEGEGSGDQVAPAPSPSSRTTVTSSSLSSSSSNGGTSIALVEQAEMETAAGSEMETAAGSETETAAGSASPSATTTAIGRATRADPAAKEKETGIASIEVTVHVFMSTSDHSLAMGQAKKVRRLLFGKKKELDAGLAAKTAWAKVLKTFGAEKLGEGCPAAITFVSSLNVHEDNNEPADWDPRATKPRTREGTGLSTHEEYEPI